MTEANTIIIHIRILAQKMESAKLQCLTLKYVFH